MIEWHDYHATQATTPEYRYPLGTVLAAKEHTFAPLDTTGCQLASDSVCVMNEALVRPSNRS